MGAAVKHRLEDAVTAAEIAGTFSGKVIGYRAERLSEDEELCFFIHNGGYMDKRGGFKAGTIKFDLIDDGEALRIVKRVGNKSLEDEIISKGDFEKYCDPRELKQHKEINIFYSYHETEAEPDIRFAGACVPGTDIEMIVRDADFLKRTIYFKRKGKVIKKEEAIPKDDLPDVTGSDYVCFKNIVDGYKTDTAKIRCALKGKKKEEDIYALAEKIPGEGNVLFFKKKYLAKVHLRLIDRGFVWANPDSPYAPSRYLKESPPDKEVSDDEVPEPVLEDKETEPLPIETEQDTEPEVVEDKPEKPEIGEAALEAAVNKAFAKGDIRIEDALYRMLPQEYNQRSEKIGQKAEQLWHEIWDYAVDNLVKTGIMYIIMEDSAMIKGEKIRDFYEDVIGRYRSKLQSFVKESGGILKKKQPDIRFTPTEIEGLYESIYNMFVRAKGPVSKTKIDANLENTWLSSLKGFKYKYLLINLVRDVYKEISDLSPLDTVDEAGAVRILNMYVIKDPELVLIEHEESIRQRDKYVKRDVIKLAIELKFKKEHDYVFYV